MNKYLNFFAISAKQAWGNKSVLIGLVFFTFILLLTYNQLWSVIGIKEGNGQINAAFLWYLLLGEIIILSPSKIEREIEYDIRSGNLSYYINKPVSFFAMRLSEALGNMSISFIFMIVFGSIITYLLTLRLPFEIKYFPTIILMCYISAIINVIMMLLVGFCALWIEDIRLLGMMAQRFAFVLGGAIFPLSIYPQWFIDIAKWTPYYSIYYLTIKLVYDFSWLNLFQALALNLIWVSIFGLLIYISYKKLYKKVEVCGG